MLARRSFLFGLIAAPLIVRASSLMAISTVVPEPVISIFPGGIVMAIFDPVLALGDLVWLGSDLHQVIATS